MTFGASNAVALRYVEESTWGTTPATPTLDAIRYTSEGLNYNGEFITSEEIRSDRMTSDTIQVSSSSDGDINGEMSYASYDDFIEGAMYSDWVTTGSTVSAATDISITKTGGTPNTWTLGSTTTDFTAQSWTVGQYVKVEGFTTAGTFYAEISGTPAATSVAIKPLTDEATEGAGDSITITPLNYVRNGTTKHSYTIQKEFTDLTTPEYQNFTGARVGAWSLDLSTGSILTTTFSFICKDANMTESQFSGATENAANTNTVLNAVDNIAAITFDGDPAGDTFEFNNLSITLDNTLRGQEAVGTLGFIGIEAGRLDLTGSIELYFENSALFDKFRAATVFQLTFMAQDTAGNAYIVNIPRAKYTSMEIVSGGLDQDVFASAEFTTIINTAGTYMFQVSRVAA
jgi:hypothetical protein